MSERTDRIRAQQTGPKVTAAEVGTAFGRWMDEMMSAHGEHPWTQIGRCVFCVPCGERMYQGTIPEGHPVGRFPSKPQPKPLIESFRDRWGDPS